MKRTVVFLALASLVVGTSGCGCCRDFFAKKNRPVATPVYSQCGPMCAPSCDPCGDAGAVTYGYGSSQGMMAMPQSFQTMPMGTTSSDCNCAN